MWLYFHEYLRTNIPFLEKLKKCEVLLDIIKNFENANPGCYIYLIANEIKLSNPFKKFIIYDKDGVEAKEPSPQKESDTLIKKHLAKVGKYYLLYGKNEV